MSKGIELNENLRRFAEREREEAEKSKEKEKNQMCLDPNSYMAKEIKYQTALLHRILNEIQTVNKKNENRSPHFSKLKRLLRSKYR